jgi:hypothetical protein
VGYFHDVARATLSAMNRRHVSTRQRAVQMRGRGQECVSNIVHPTPTKRTAVTQQQRCSRKAKPLPRYTVRWRIPRSALRVSDKPCQSACRRCHPAPRGACRGGTALVRRVQRCVCGVSDWLTTCAARAQRGPSHARHSRKACTLKGSTVSSRARERCSARSSTLLRRQSHPN